MKNITLSIAILLVSAGLASPSAMARETRGGAPSPRPRVENRGPVHGPRVSKPQPPIGVRHSDWHYGMRVRTIPHGRPIHYRGMSYMYCDGVFFSVRGGDYEVVRPVVGMTVPSLPAGCMEIRRGGQKYYTHRGILYSSVRERGVIVYRVAGFM